MKRKRLSIYLEMDYVLNTNKADGQLLLKLLYIDVIIRALLTTCVAVARGHERALQC